MDTTPRNANFLLPVMIALAFCVPFSLTLAQNGDDADVLDEATFPRESEYSAQIDECLSTPETRRGNIIDFLCVSGKSGGSDFDVAYQVILDLIFQQIDADAEDYVAGLENSGATPISDVSESIASSFDGGGVFSDRYRAWCQNVLSEAIKHFGEVTTEGDIAQYLTQNSSLSRCETLVRKKLAAYREAAWIVAGRSAVSAYESGKSQLMRDTHNAFERLAGKMMIFVGQLSVVRDKMPSKTKQVITGPF